MASKKGGRGLSEAQRTKVVMLAKKGRTYKQIRKETGHAISTICRVMQTHRAAVGGGKEVKKKPVKPRKTGRTDAMPRPDEKDYLLWALNGALNGWVDRLIRDIRDNKFAS